MSSTSSSRFFLAVPTKRKRDEERKFPDRPVTFDDSANIEKDSKSLLQGNASNPLTIDDDSDSDVEVVPWQASIQSIRYDVGALEEANETSPPKADRYSVVTSPQQVSQALPNGSERRKDNPFAKFAFAAEGVSEMSLPPRPSLTWRSSNTPSATCDTYPAGQRSTASFKTLERRPTKQKTKCQFLPMRSISTEEQDTITRKWHSLADPKAPLEVRRFQILLAARLHARCQEPSVRKAMSVLREAFAELTVSVVAQADPEVLALHITNLQYYNTKAQQIVKAAKEIETDFHGIVPEDETSLLRITGVGKVFADLLAFVNTREIHERYIQADQGGEGAAGGG